MNDLEEIKDEITTLVFSGKKEEALLLLQKKYGVNREEAEQLLTVAIQENSNPADFFKRVPNLVSASVAGKRGCKGSIFWMLAFVFGFFGIPMLLAALGIGTYFYYEDKDAIKISGTVEEYDSYFDEAGIEQFTPIVTYAIDGEVFSFKGTFYSNPPDYELGDAVPLGVDPTDPESAYIDTYYERWFVVVLLGSISLGFIFLMIVFRIMSKRL